MDKEMIFENIAIVGVGILIGILLYIGCSWSIKQKDKEFYNGCQCGGHWEFQQVVGHQTTTGYIYKCDKCNDIKEYGKYYNTERKEN